MNLAHVRIIGEILMTQDHVHIGKCFFFYIVLPAVVGRCCSQLASNVDPSHLAKSLLAPPIPFYIYYTKKLDIFLYHDEFQDVLAVGVGLGPLKKNNTCNTTDVAKHTDSEASIQFRSSLL